MIGALILDADGVVILGERLRTVFARELGITTDMTGCRFCRY